MTLTKTCIHPQKSFHDSAKSKDFLSAIIEALPNGLKICSDVFSLQRTLNFKGKSVPVHT